jgi:hypothetical protein
MMVVLAGTGFSHTSGTAVGAYLPIMPNGRE